VEYSTRDLYKENIDIFILDMIVPQMGGCEAYDRIKDTNPGIEVLLSSGSSIDSQARKMLDRG